MRRLIAGLCCACVVIATAICVDAAAPSMQLISSQTELRPGDTFYVEARLENKSLTNYCTVKLEFDENQLSLTGGKCEIDPGDGIATVAKDMKAGTLMVLIPRMLSGNVFTFRFSVNENATVGDVLISAKATVEKNVYMDVSAATIKVVSQATDSTASAEGTEPSQSPDTPAPSMPTTGSEAVTEATGDSTIQATDGTIHNDPSGNTEGADSVPTPEPEEEESADTGWIWIIAAGAAAAIGVIFVILKKKESQ